MKHEPFVDYDSRRNEITVHTPDAALYEMARAIPGVHERRSQGVWAAPATAAVAARVVEIYGASLTGTKPFIKYLAGQVTAHAKAIAAANATEWPEIPITALQPEGKWLHQRKAFWFAYPLDAVLLDVAMGGGKTKIAIDLLLNWEARDVLVITPLAAIDDVWLPHLENHMACKFAVCPLGKGTSKFRTEVAEVALDNALNPEPHRIIIINWESVWREPFRTWAANQRWDLVIADEVHRAKSAGSFVSKFLFQLGSRASKRLGLTGTSMPHSPLDVYGQYRYLDRGIFGTNHDRFLEKYATFGGYEDREIVGFKNLKDMRAKFFTIAIQIDDSAQGLPAVAPDIEHKVDLEPKVEKIYDELDKEFITKIGRRELTAANSGVKLLRLHQLACGIAKTDDGHVRHISTAKIDGLRDRLLDFRRDEPIVIFTRFTPDLYSIQEMLVKMGRTVALVGDGCQDLQLWKKGFAAYLVAQIQAIKEGVDLTRSAIGIFYSTGISLGDYLQCRKRLHRPPQKKMVRFIHILARGTRDVSTMRSLHERHDVIKDLFNGRT